MSEEIKREAGNEFARERANSFEPTAAEIKKIEIVENMPSSELKELTADEFKNEINEEQKAGQHAQPQQSSEPSQSSDGNNTTNNSSGAPNSEDGMFSTISIDGSGNEQLNAPQPPPPQSKAAEASSLAKLMTVLGDFIVPPVVSIVAKKAFDKEIPASAMKAEKDELKAIESAWMEYLLVANWTLTPEWRLAIALIGVYGAKAVMISMDEKVYAKPEKAKQERPLNRTPMSDGNLPLAGERLPNGRKATRKPGETRGRKPR